MYFKEKGTENTLKTVELAIDAAIEKNIKHIVVASNSGSTAQLFKNDQGINIVCVTHVNGMVKNGENEMPEETRTHLINSGFKVLTTTHVLSGAERGISRNFGGVNPVEIIAHSLRMLGQGTKVGVEVSVMALDAGLIPFGEKIIAIGGSGRGADTALVITPAHASRIFETYIHEFICKPMC